MTKNYCIYASTHTGKVREVNEDNFVLNTLTKDVKETFQHLKVRSVKEPLLLGVFDGMGGEKGGFEASRMCAGIAGDYYRYLLKEKKTLEDTVEGFAIRCDIEIQKFLADHNYQRGGSTFALAFLQEGKMHLASMGDSRLYLLREGTLFRISRDHTLANMKFEANIYTKEEAEESPESHMLTRYLGMNFAGREAEVEIYNPISLNPGDKLLICSDGLYDMCRESEIEEVLNHSDKGYASALTRLALDKGGYDNITCIVVENADQEGSV